MSAATETLSVPATGAEAPERPAGISSPGGDGATSIADRVTVPPAAPVTRRMPRGRPSISTTPPSTTLASQPVPPATHRPTPIPTPKPRRSREVQAECLRLGLLPIAMSAVIDQPEAFDAGGCQAYVEAELARVGNPDDPVERMFLTQTVLLHVRVSLLHARAALTTGEAAKLLNAAAARLTGELRRVGLAADALRRRRQRRERRAAGE